MLSLGMGPALAPQTQTLQGYGARQTPRTQSSCVEAYLLLFNQGWMDGWLINRSQVRCYLAVLSKDGACTGTADPNSFEAGMGPDRHLEPNRPAFKLVFFFSIKDGWMAGLSIAVR
jgi:hypothetical protein